MTTLPGADAEAFRALARRWAATVTVVTARRRGSAPRPDLVDLDGFTCTAFLPVSIEPPLVLVSVTNAQSPLAILRGSDAFAVNLLGHEQEVVSAAFSRPQSERPEVWRQIPWAPDGDGSPLLANTAGAFSARVRQFVDAGDHTLVIGEVTAIHLGEGSEALLYHHRGYGRFDRF